MVRIDKCWKKISIALRGLLRFIKVYMYIYFDTLLKNNSSTYTVLANKIHVENQDSKLIDLLLTCRLRMRPKKLLQKYSHLNNFTITRQYAKLHFLYGNGLLGFKVLEKYLATNKRFSFFEKILLADTLRRLIAYFPEELDKIKPDIKLYLIQVNEFFKNLFFKKNIFINIAFVDYLLHSANELEKTYDVLQLVNKYLKFYSLPGLTIKDNNSNFNVNNLSSHHLPGFDKFLGKISVVMAAKNVGLYIKAAVESILKQTYPYWELIIIDDNSNDDTYSIATKIASQDNRVICLKSEVEVGAGKARNIGMRKANGEYLMFHDADDFSHPLRLEVMIKAINKHKKLIALTHQYVRLGMDGKFFSNLIWPYTKNTPIAMIMRRNIVLDKVGYMHDVHSEDAEYWERLILAFGKKKTSMVYLPLLIAAHRENSLSNGAGFANEKKCFFDKKQYGDWELWSEDLLQQAVTIVSERGA